MPNLEYWLRCHLEQTVLHLHHEDYLKGCSCVLITEHIVFFSVFEFDDYLKYIANSHTLFEVAKNHHQ